MKNLYKLHLIILKIQLLSCGSSVIHQADRSPKKESSSHTSNQTANNSSVNRTVGIDTKDQLIQAPLTPLDTTPDPSPLPKPRMMMLDVEHGVRASSKTPISDQVLSFEELGEAGINAILIRAFNNKAYTAWEQVEEIHNHGFWSVGAPHLQSGYEELLRLVQRQASLSNDFLQFDEPFDWNSCRGEERIGYRLDEQRYKELKAEANRFKPTPIVVTDVNCNHVLRNWSSLDGLFNEMYFDQWYDKYMPDMLDYKDRNPNKFVGNWVWLLDHGDPYLGTPTVVSLSQFRYWTTQTYDNLGNVMLFIFQGRQKGSSLQSNGTNWPEKVRVIRNLTSGFTYPSWKNFKQSTTHGAIDASVEVQSNQGINLNNIKVYYSTMQNGQITKWVRHQDLSIKATEGSRGTITISAHKLPSIHLGTGNNYNGPKVRFELQEEKLIRGLRNVRILKKDFGLTRSQIGFHSLTKPNDKEFEIKVKDSTGFKNESITSEFSSDNGKTWQKQQVQIIASESSPTELKIKVNNLQFVADTPKTNKLRFSIKNKDNTTINSEHYTVSFSQAPQLSDKTIAKVGNNYDVQLTYKDPDGIIWGHQKAKLHDQSLVLLPFDKNTQDQSGLGYNAKLKNQTRYESSAWLATRGANDSALCFDGNASFAEVGHVYLDQTHNFTLSGWFKAENNAPFITIGAPSERGALTIGTNNTGKLVFSANDIIERFGLTLQSNDNLVTKNQWHYFAFTFSKNIVSLYLDGQLVEQKDLKDNVNPRFETYDFRPLRFALQTLDNNSFKGCVDEFHAIGTALSANEVANRYFSGSYRYSTDNGNTWSTWQKSTSDANIVQDKKINLKIPSMGKILLEVNINDLHGNLKYERFKIENNQISVIE